jgi:hypothetical protein
MKIIDEKFYTPKQIANLGVTKAKTEDTRRQMVLRKINQGKFEDYVNVGSKLKPRYLVQGRHIKNYLDRQVKVYQKK